MSEATTRRLVEASGQTGWQPVQTLQSLWSGWGVLARYRAPDGRPCIVKHVRPPSAASHPRGWTSDVASARKRRSYEVERHFYANHVPSLTSVVRLPTARLVADDLLVMSDLDAEGLGERGLGRRDPAARLDAALAWLARFHAATLDRPPEGLWAEGCYWHLATRPDELRAMRPGPLREGARALDEALRACPHQAWVHGDAKLANLCFGAGADCAFVDFQYVGGGVGVRDVAYLLGSCLSDRALEAEADAWLDRYLDHLAAAGAGRAVDAWRALWPVAWADFERFLEGWAPGHAKRTGYSARATQQGLARVRAGASATPR